MNKRKLAQRAYSLIMIFLLFLQSSAQTVGAVTSGSGAGNDSTKIQLLGANQTAAGSRDIDLKLSVSNPVDDSIHREVSVSFSNNQELKETHDANILDENQKIIGKYTYSGKNLQLKFLGHVSETVTIQLSLTNVSSLAGFVNFSVDGQKVAAKLSDTASATKVSKPLANVSSKMVSNVAATTQKTTSVSDP
ncbi:hypothetical protein CHT97_13420, partial [Lacticaseibacillus chiayiensis]